MRHHVRIIAMPNFLIWKVQTANLITFKTNVIFLTLSIESDNNNVRLTFNMKKEKTHKRRKKRERLSENDI